MLEHQPGQRDVDVVLYHHDVQGPRELHEGDSESDSHVHDGSRVGSCGTSNEGSRLLFEYDG